MIGVRALDNVPQLKGTGMMNERAHIRFTEHTFSIIATTMMATALLCPLSLAGYITKADAEARIVAYKKIGTGDYQNFLKNWDELRNPVLFALIQSSAQYDALFHPAAVMGNNRPFAPDAGIYEKEWILVVARVMPAPDNMDKVFEVEQITEREKELIFHYRYTVPNIKATFIVKNFLAVRIPRLDCEKVTFFENGKLIGKLKLTAGQWSVPASAPEPNSSTRQ